CRLAASLEGAQRVLHDPVLEGVKGDHDQARARAQAARGRLEKTIEALELTVHPDPQRLERTCRGIDSRVATPRHGAPDDRREASGGVDRRLAACGDDRARDAARESLLAVGENRV